MKKIILTVAAVFAFGFANAQDGKFKVGAHVGLPIGDYKDSYSLNLGADFAYTWKVSDKFDDLEGDIEGLALDFKNHIITEEESEELKLISNNYTKTWITFKNSARFKSGILKDFEKSEI